MGDERRGDPAELAVDAALRRSWAEQDRLRARLGKLLTAAERVLSEADLSLAHAHLLAEAVRQARGESP